MNQSTEVDRELLLEFFLTFARFEQSLKVAGYAQSGKGQVRPDWQQFGLDCADSFKRLDDPILKSACEYFDHHSPMKQVLVDGALGWCEKDPTGSNELLILLEKVKRVRNNLFHGGKHNRARLEEESKRTEKLLRHSLTILEACVPISPKFNSCYSEAWI